jgi:hypothetical protein
VIAVFTLIGGLLLKLTFIEKSVKVNVAVMECDNVAPVPVKVAVYDPAVLE